MLCASPFKFLTLLDAHFPSTMLKSFIFKGAHTRVHDIFLVKHVFVLSILVWLQVLASTHFSSSAEVTTVSSSMCNRTFSPPSPARAGSRAWRTDARSSPRVPALVLRRRPTEMPAPEAAGAHLLCAPGQPLRLPPPAVPRGTQGAAHCERADLVNPALWTSHDFPLRFLPGSPGGGKGRE